MIHFIFSLVLSFNRNTYFHFFLMFLKRFIIFLHIFHSSISFFVFDCMMAMKSLSFLSLSITIKGSLVMSYHHDVCLVSFFCCCLFLLFFDYFLIFFKLYLSSFRMTILTIIMIAIMFQNNN